MAIFKLPDLGEGLPDAEISQWHVQVGDLVKKDQILVSMETAKALVEVPSPFAGRVTKLHGNPGDIIQTGAPLVEFQGENVSEKVEATKDKGTVAGRLETSDRVIEAPSLAVSETYVRAGSVITVKATPAIRALAERLKVDLKSIHPTGPDGNITSQDVEKMAKIQDEAGPLELLKGVRRSMIQSMTQAHANVVSVTVVEDANLKQLTLEQAFSKDITVSVIQAMIEAQKQEPSLNAWYDGQSMGRRLIKATHVGMAMDNSEGLFVPVIHHAEQLSKADLRNRIDTLKKEVESRKILPENLRGASIALTNFGKFSGRYANPIIVPPMVAILGVGGIREEAVVIENAVRICTVLPLSLTFDHRAVTGGEACRYLAHIIAFLEKI